MLRIPPLSKISHEFARCPGAQSIDHIHVPRHLAQADKGFVVPNSQPFLLQGQSPPTEMCVLSALGRVRTLRTKVTSWSKVQQV